MLSRRISVPSVTPDRGFKRWFRRSRAGQKTAQSAPDPPRNQLGHAHRRPRSDTPSPSSKARSLDRVITEPLHNGDLNSDRLSGLDNHKIPPPSTTPPTSPPPPPQEPTPKEPGPRQAHRNLSLVGQGVDSKKADSSLADLEGPLPKAVPCKLVVFLDDKKFPHFEEARCYWHDTSYFNILQNAALRILEDQGNVDPKDESTRLYKRAGRCRLVRRDDDFEVDSIIIENKRQWAQFLPLMVAKFAANNHFVPFDLEFRWEYSLLIINRQVGVPYAETVKVVLYDRMKTNHKDQKYIPRKVLDNLFKPATVRELIDQDESLKRLAQTLLNESGQVFDKEKFISHVVADGIIYLALCVYTGLPLECLYRLMDKYKECTTLLQASDCPKGMSKPVFDYLVQLQGGFNAHTFTDDGGHPIHRKLDNSIVVPIKFHEQNDLIGSGGFGEVFRVQIDPDHHRFSPDRDTVYALKRFHTTKLTETYFEKEAKALMALSRVPHPNITLHLASWTQDGRFYMLFPCAESNLQSHLLVEPAPELNKEFVIFLLTQMRDLAATVEHIHNLNIGKSIQKAANVAHKLGADFTVGTEGKYRHTGFHYDLKPDNILIFQRDKKTGPIWRVGDFGTAQINEIVFSGSQQHPIGSKRVEESNLGDPEYCAPDKAYQGWSSRPYDIWSLGCIYLQVLLWTFGSGGQHLLDFEVQRLHTSESHGHQSNTFWYRDQKYDLKLKPAVVKKIRDLQSCCKNRGVFEDLVSLTAYMLTITPKDRPQASVVRSAISALLIQAENDLENPEAYKDDLREREVIAKPATAVRSRSRPESIDLRSVTANPDTPDRVNLPRLGPGEHRRSFSEPLRKSDSLDVDDHAFVGDHFENAEIIRQRSRSPSISIMNPEGTTRVHQETDFQPPPMLSYLNTVGNQDI